MNLLLIAHHDSTTESDGTEIKEYNNAFVSPLIPRTIPTSIDSYCWILYQNWFGRWQIKEQVLISINYTNTWHYRFANGWCINIEALGRTLFLHDELKKAKEECIRRNKLQKVKVKEYHG